MAATGKLCMARNLFLAAFLLLLGRLCRGEALYTGTDVVELTASSFKSKVLEDHRIWMIEFYAPWCGHCQRLKPDYIKAATASKGIVRFGAVNAEEHRSIGGEYGVRGFPTLKIFGTNKKKPTDYNGARSAKAMADAAIAHLPNLVTVLSSTTHAPFLEGRPQLPKAVLFTAKGSTTALYKALALDLQDRMALAEVRARPGDAVALLARHGLAQADLPALLAFPAGAAEGAPPPKYAGELKHRPLLEFLAKHALPRSARKGKGGKTEKESKRRAEAPTQPSSGPAARSRLQELRTAADVEQHCGRGAGFCVLTFLPPEDAAQVARLLELATKYAKDPLTFVWADPSKLPQLKALVSAEAGPVTAVLSGKRRKFAVHVGLEGLEGLLDRAVGGDLQMTARLPDSWHALDSS